VTSSKDRVFQAKPEPINLRPDKFCSNLKNRRPTEKHVFKLTSMRADQFTFENG